MNILRIGSASLLPLALVGVMVSLAQPPAPKPASPAPPTEDVDAITKQAAALEANLAKLNSTTPAAAEAMLKLIDLYHSNGRPFGLVRVAQLFVNQHSTHARHKDVMLKLIDALTAAGRNKELLATGRQFLSRYPGDAACAEVERWLLHLVRRTGDNAALAALHEAHWKRLGTTTEGRRSGREAQRLYFAMNTKESNEIASTLGEELLDKLPAGGPATYAGWVAMEACERRSDWAKANHVAAKLLAKSPPHVPYYLQLLHNRMADNYSRLGQRTNAAESFRKAGAVAKLLPRRDLHSRMLSELYQTTPTPAAFEAEVNKYVQAWPDAPDRYSQQALIGHLALAAKDTAKAEAVFAALLPLDARANNAVGNYVQLFGNEMDMAARTARLAKAEQTLRDAVAKSKDVGNAAALRYHLGLDILRDRVKDLPKAKAMMRELAFQFPSNDSYASSAIHWLLDSAADDAEFNADLAKAVAVIKQKPYLASLRTSLQGWATARKGNKALAPKLALVKQQIAGFPQDAQLAAWLAYDAVANNNDRSFTARVKLLEPNLVKSYPDEIANSLLYNQQHYLRHQAPNAKRPECVAMAKRWAERFPESTEAAGTYLAWVTDFSDTKEYRDAVTMMLKFDPTRLQPDHFRRMMAIVAAQKDVALAKQVWAWCKKGYSRDPNDISYITGIGDTLNTLKLEAEAKDAWSIGLAGNPFSGDYRECSNRLLNLLKTDPEKLAHLDQRLAVESPWQFAFAVQKADMLVKAGQLDPAIALIQSSLEAHRDRAFTNDYESNEWSTIANWVWNKRSDMMAKPGELRKLAAFVRDLGMLRTSMVGAIAALELPEEVASLPPMTRLVRLGQATQLGYGDSTDFDLIANFTQAAMTRKDYQAAAALSAGALANCQSIDDGRRKNGRDLLTQAYTRLGAAGGAVIDEKSPIAPLLEAALQLRLGDAKLAFETYLANQKLFDEHRADVPIDLLLFVCEKHIAAAGDENHDRVEDILRGWVIKNSESKDVDAVDKARVQLLLARNYYRSRRYDLARAEFTTVLNRYKETPQAVDAEFGIGETFMEQKVYDQAELTFERLANRRERDVVIRAEFLRGVLANRRGDLDEARIIFRRVLERVPNIELANEALYNLSEVYGAEQRYVDQLELLRTVGRLGRASKRWHTPGEPISIVVQDSDLGVSRGHSRIPVIVTTEPGGDSETTFLLSGGAGKGLFRADLETRLGSASKNDRILQLTGQDVIRVDYPPDFKKEFKDAPPPDTEIRIAADGRLEVASGKIFDQTEETFSAKLEREVQGDDAVQTRSSVRPRDQVKPGNTIYLRIKDADRDLTNDPDTLRVKLTSAGGDQVGAVLTETGPHTGIFEGTAKTGELPAGALATNTAIDHSPLMAIDKDPLTTWLSEPDGATPKLLTADMKDLKTADRVVVTTPDAKDHAPVRMTLEGSDDGRTWFRLAVTPDEKPPTPLATPYEQMTARIYEGNEPLRFTTWDQIAAFVKGKPAVEQTKATELLWSRDPEEKAKRGTAVLWQGKIVQPKSGTVRFALTGDVAALLIDGRLELAPGSKDRLVDVALSGGTHDLAIFVAAQANRATLEARWVQGDTTATNLIPTPFRAADFDLSRPDAKPGTPRALGEGTMSKEGTSWEFKFPPIGLRYARVVIHEYRGEAVAINHLTIEDSVKKVVHLPTEADLLSLSSNDILEIAGGDSVVATYIDDVNTTGSSRLLTARLTATYHNGDINPIGYAFERVGDGQILTHRKDLLRIDPGERIIIEVVDFDRDQTAERDKIQVQVSINDGTPQDLEATETEVNSGIFTKEVDTTGEGETGKLAVKTGDRIYLRYLDEQNTLPGHAKVRETVVYVNEPTLARVRIVESRAVRPKGMLANAPARMIYLPAKPDEAPDAAAGVALEAPLTVEVFDRDAAKDSLSTVVVTLTTTDGAKVDVECVLSDRRVESATGTPVGTALEEGHFTGQVIMQLGGKDSSSIVPLTSSMPRNLIGGPKLPDDPMNPQPDRRRLSLVTQILAVSGTDTIQAGYNDKLRPGEPAKALSASARLLTDGKLTCTDSEYVKPVLMAHVGERLYLQVEDADHDRTAERDTVKVVVSSERGEKETIELIETLSHSGIFTTSAKLIPVEKPTPGNVAAVGSEIECFFGDALNLVYTDDRSGSTDGLLESVATVNVVIGTDGKLQAFSKAVTDENLAVETQFHIAESHFELFKSHKTLGREDEAKLDLEAGRRVLREVMEDYPNPKYAPRVAYLFGQFAQELKQYGEAIQAYELIVKQYPDHTLAPDAQFKLAQTYEESNEFEQALEAYVTLAATYPNHALIANVMVRISEHFYKSENYKIAAQVGEKFLEKFEGHEWAPKIAYFVGQCYYKDKQYVKAGQSFDRFAKLFHENELAPLAMFWCGESYRTGGNNREAFRRYNKCRWDYPASEAAKYARGRLALPEMLSQFEAESANLDDK